MAEYSVLIVEDEDKIADVLHDYLLQAGYQAHRLKRGDDVAPWLAHHHADLLLLDVMLPGKNGLDICKSLRERDDTLPAIILVTARVEEIDRLLGLELGADDYICKPFSPREVIARVKTVLRRLKQPTATLAVSPQSEGLYLDAACQRACLDGRDLCLTVVEFQLLTVLTARPGRIFSRDQLMNAMYRDERVVADRTVDSHVKKLRRKVQTVRPSAELIQSVYGLGYKYEP